MEYLRFDRHNLCNAPYPVNNIEYRLNFYKISGLSHDLNELDYALDGILHFPPGVHKIPLGLPLGFIFNHLGLFGLKDLTKSRTLPLKLGFEGIVMPFSPKENTKPPTEIVLHGQDIDNRRFNLNGQSIPLRPDVIQALEQNNTVLYKRGDALFRFTRAQTVQYVFDDSLTHNSVLSNYARHPLNQAQFRELTTTGKLVLPYLGDELEFHLVRPVSSAPITPSNAKAQVRALSVPGMLDQDLIEYGKTIWFPANQARFDLVVGQLLADPRAGASNNRYGKDTADAQLKNFISRMPWQAPRSLSQRLPMPNLFGQQTPWTPFDLKTLLKLYKTYRQASFYQSYIRRIVIPRLPRIPCKIKLPRYPQYEIGIVATYEQTWRLLGYSRGALLSSISLAPKEDLSIEIFTFDRLKTDNESTFSTEFEKNLEVNSQSRIASKIARDLSNTTDSKADVGLGIPIPAGDIPIKVNGNFDIKNEVRDQVQSSVDELNDKTIKATERFKSTTQVKVVQSEESGEEKRVIRKIQNPNSSRTLTFNYFEILENYSVTTRCVPNLQLCLLVENPDLGGINLDFVLAYEDLLTRALLSPIFQPGFDAAKKLAAQRWFEDRRKKDLEASQKAQDDAEEQSKPIEKYIIRIARNLLSVLNKFLGDDLNDAMDTLGRHINPLESNKPSEDEVDAAIATFNEQFFWAKFKLAYPGVGDKADQFVQAIDAADPLDEATALAQVETFVIGLDDDWLSQLKTIAVDAAIGAGIATLLAGPEALLLGAVLAVLADLLLAEKDLGLPGLVTEAKKEVKLYQQQTSLAAPPPAPSDASAATAPPAEPEVFTLEELATANADFQRLALHLEANKVYYLNKIWGAEVPEVRLERFRLKGIDRFVDNELLGFVGNKAAYPLRLQALPPALQTYLSNQVIGQDPNKKKPPLPFDDVQIQSVALPTNGVYMESMVGNCEALEPFLLRHRVLDVRDKRADVKLKIEQARQAAKETERYALRLEQQPPLLEFPQPVPKDADDNN